MLCKTRSRVFRFWSSSRLWDKTTRVSNPPVDFSHTITIHFYFENPNLLSHTDRIVFMQNVVQNIPLEKKCDEKMRKFGYLKIEVLCSCLSDLLVNYDLIRIPAFSTFSLLS